MIAKIIDEMIDSELEALEQARQRQLDSNAKKASQIKGSQIWNIATRNNLKPKVIRLIRWKR